MTGVLRKDSNNIALAKAPADLHEYDYYILGHIKHFRRDGVGARDIWAKGSSGFQTPCCFAASWFFTIWSSRQIALL
jgi:hypothetical protein